MNPLPGIPHVESPFFAELFDREDPDFEVAHALSTRGYAVIDFPDDEIEQITDRVIAALSDHICDSECARIQDAWSFNDDVKRLACNDKILSLLQKLYGRRAFPFQTLNFPFGSEQHYHSDSIHFSSLPERFMCGVWLALENIGDQQGPLVYYPGSHCWPIYKNEHVGHIYRPGFPAIQETYEPVWERLVSAHNLAPEYFLPRKGQALIWAANILHGGAKHLNRELTRWSQVTHYYFDDCCYYTPMLSNEAIGDLYLREPFNIVTGETVGSRYGGEAVTSGSVGFSGTEPPFDPAAYLAMNPDVADANYDPWQHFVRFGRRERRRWY